MKTSQVALEVRPRFGSKGDRFQEPKRRRHEGDRVGASTGGGLKSTRWFTTGEKPAANETASAGISSNARAEEQKEFGTGIGAGKKKRCVGATTGRPTVESPPPPLVPAKYVSENPSSCEPIGEGIHQARGRLGQSGSWFTTGEKPAANETASAGISSNARAEEQKEFGTGLALGRRKVRWGNNRKANGGSPLSFRRSTCRRIRLAANRSARESTKLVGDWRKAGREYCVHGK
ncbi:hypothetical protein quinque_002570 [Culex quinquefasciatus]